MKESYTAKPVDFETLADFEASAIAPDNIAKLETTEQSNTHDRASKLHTTMMEEMFQPCLILTSDLSEQARQALSSNNETSELHWLEIGNDPSKKSTTTSLIAQNVELQSGRTIDVSLAKTTDSLHTYLGAIVMGKLFVPAVQFIGRKENQKLEENTCDYIRFGQELFDATAYIGAKADLNSSVRADQLEALTKVLWQNFTDEDRTNKVEIDQEDATTQEASVMLQSALDILGIDGYIQSFLGEPNPAKENITNTAFTLLGNNTSAERTICITDQPISAGKIKHTTDTHVTICVTQDASERMRLTVHSKAVSVRSAARELLALDIDPVFGVLDDAADGLTIELIDELLQFYLSDTHEVVNQTVTSLPDNVQDRSSIKTIEPRRHFITQDGKSSPYSAESRRHFRIHEDLPRKIKKQMKKDHFRQVRRHKNEQKAQKKFKEQFMKNDIKLIKSIWNCDTTMQAAQLYEENKRIIDRFIYEGLTGRSLTRTELDQILTVQTGTGRPQRITEVRNIEWIFTDSARKARAAQRAKRFLERSAADSQ